MPSTFEVTKPERIGTSPECFGLKASLGRHSKSSNLGMTEYQIMSVTSPRCLTMKGIPRTFKQSNNLGMTKYKRLNMLHPLDAERHTRDD